MRKRVLLGSGVLLLAILITLLVLQGSFTLEPVAPGSVEQTYLFWALSTVIFILTVALAFMLLRTFVRLFIERQSNRVGSQLKGKLVGGAFALSFLPVIFLVLWSVTVLNRSLDKWFSLPGQHINNDLVDVGNAIDAQVDDKLKAQGHWMSFLLGSDDNRVYDRFCKEQNIARAQFTPPYGPPQVLCGHDKGAFPYTSVIDVPGGKLTLSAGLPVDLAAKKADIDRAVKEYKQLSVDNKRIRNIYLLLLTLITLFVLFFATWLARYLASQITTPITALLDAAQRIRKGDLGYRVNVAAIDELATFVRAFNEMTAELETNSKELEARRLFNEAILESVPTGVISLASDGRIQRTNRALMGILPEAQVRAASKLEDLFPNDYAAEIRYLMNRARRTGVAGTQFEYETDAGVLHLSVTVAALDERQSAGFVLSIEDTSELLRAQKAMAWSEVARRVAHEIKNPLTPIALCADRIARQLDRPAPAAGAERILRECSATIAREVQSVKMLVDEFAQFTRLPAPHPGPTDLNEVVRNGLAIFEGRLEAVALATELADELPLVHIDAEQFKRVVVNLVDNAAEAMQDTPVKELYISTRATGDSVELIVADTGCGISKEDKERLFLPYFSTKGRGTGLGLAIVSRIVADHNAMIRVEDNRPSGARFLVEIPIYILPDSQRLAEPSAVRA